MAKIILSDLSSFLASGLTTLSSNNVAIRAAFEKTLSRDGTAPNSMLADFDMNSNQILNLPAAVDDTDPVRLGEYRAMTDQRIDDAIEVLTGLAGITDLVDSFLGVLSPAQMPAFTGDITSTVGTVATTLATVNSSPGSYGNSTNIPTIVVDGKGRATSVSNHAVIAPAGTLSGTTLASNVVTSSLTTIGALTGLQIAASGYVNFSTPTGTSGYGLRDSAGTIQVKNSGGSWVNIPTTGVTQWGDTGSDIYFNTGSVGIGTTTPAYPLVISGSGNTPLLNVFSSTNSVSGYFQAGGTATGVYAGSLSNHSFNFVTNQSVRATIDTSGRLGIGTLTPTAPLEVNGQTGSPSQGLLVTTHTFTPGSVGSYLRLGHGASSGNTYGVIENMVIGGTDFGNLSLQSGGGKVGIGTTTPVEKLHISGAAAADTSLVLGVGNTTGTNDGLNLGYSGLSFGVGSSYLNAHSATGTTGTLHLLTDSSIRMTLAGSGKIGIGTTTPLSLLHIAGTTLTKTGPVYNVLAWGVLQGNITAGATTTTNTANIQACIDACYAAGGGIVYFPPGGYKINSRLIVPAQVFLVGDGPNTSIITSYYNTPGGSNLGDFILVEFRGAGGGAVSYNGARHIGVLGSQSLTATNPCVNTTSDCINGIFESFRIEGGFYGLQNANSVDCIFLNCPILGSASAGGCLVSNGGNWYIRCKFDTTAAQAYGAWIQWNGVVGGVAENAFINCDFTNTAGYTTAAIRIDDTGHNNAATSFSHCVFAGVVNINSHKWTGFSLCEFGGNITTGGNTSLVGCVAPGGAITATNCLGAGNINITGYTPG